MFLLSLLSLPIKIMKAPFKALNMSNRFLKALKKRKALRSRRYAPIAKELKTIRKILNELAKAEIKNLRKLEKRAYKNQALFLNYPLKISPMKSMSNSNEIEQVQSSFDQTTAQYRSEISLLHGKNVFALQMMTVLLDYWMFVLNESRYIEKSKQVMNPTVREQAAVSVSTSNLEAASQGNLIPLVKAYPVQEINTSNVSQSFSPPPAFNPEWIAKQEKKV